MDTKMKPEHTICTIFSDIYLMEKKLLGKRKCYRYMPLFLSTLRRKLNKTSKTMPFDDAVRYRDRVDQCESCQKYIGVMPEYKSK